MVNIRSATIADLAEMQNANLQCLPENYQMKSERCENDDGSGESGAERRTP